MKIAIEVKRDAALRAGRDEYGISVVEIPASELTEAERAELALTCRRTEAPMADCDLAEFMRDLPGNRPIQRQATDPAEATAETVRAEIEARIGLRVRIKAEEKERAEAKRRETEEKNRQLLALPVEERLTKRFANLDWKVVAHPRGPLAPPEFGPWAAEAQAEADRRNAAIAELAKKTEAGNEAGKARKRGEVEAWIRERGSERLLMILEEDLLDDSMAVYHDERLAAELPGWEWDDDGADKEIRNPSETALRALREARKEVGEIVSGLHLGYIWYDPDQDDYDGSGRGVVALQAEFLGRDVRKTVE